jgi:hypothetical protein
MGSESELSLKIVTRKGKELFEVESSIPRESVYDESVSVHLLAD